MSNTITLRVVSPDHGTKRIQVKPSEKMTDFYKKVKEEFGLDDNGWAVYKNRNNTDELISSRLKTVSSYKLRHGDQIYLTAGAGGGSVTAPMDTGDSPGAGFLASHKRGSTASLSSRPGGSTASLSSLAGATSERSSFSVIEDDVDQFLSKEDGKISRGRNDQMCHHGPKGKCLHCVPVEPYDENYLRSCDPPIKFLSFHAYLRKLTGGVDKGKFAMLENISCRIKPGCKGHPPWPEGICTKCQPNALTLNRQVYRHVDYIQFENPFLMEQFLNFWRNTGNQRIGFMYGRYEHHKDVPLGIKAVVAAIYEPPQISGRNSVELLPNPHEEQVDSIAEQLGLRRVGWIFTDLVAQDLKTGTVKHFRGNIKSHFLSAEECITAADFQNKHPNPCRLSPDGHFGSKFVTVVVTGDESRQIHFEGYQVSNQCMALVSDECLISTVDAPELGYVKESSNQQYVPDVFFKEKDSYGNEVTQLARPLPVEYLLVDLPAAFPVEPVFTFHAQGDAKPFIVENRSEIGELQDFNAFCAYMNQYPRDKFLEAVSDFHALVYLATCDMLPVADSIGNLLDAVKTKDEEAAYHWSKLEQWATVEQLMQATGPSPPTSRQTSFVGPGAPPLPPIPGSATGGATPSSSTAMWTCVHCTYINQPSAAACEVCTLPPN